MRVVADALQLFNRCVQVKRLDVKYSKWMAKKAVTRTGVPQQVFRMLGTETGGHVYTRLYQLQHQGTKAEAGVRLVEINERLMETRAR